MACHACNFISMFFILCACENQWGISRCAPQHVQRENVLENMKMKVVLDICVCAYAAWSQASSSFTESIFSIIVLFVCVWNLVWLGCRGQHTLIKRDVASRLASVGDEALAHSIRSRLRGQNRADNIHVGQACFCGLHARIDGLEADIAIHRSSALKLNILGNWLRLVPATPPANARRRVGGVLLALRIGIGCWFRLIQHLRTNHVNTSRKSLSDSPGLSWANASAHQLCRLGTVITHQADWNHTNSCNNTKDDHAHGRHGWRLPHGAGLLS